MSRRVPPRGFFDGESPFGRLPVEPGFPTVKISGRATGLIVLLALGALLLFLLKPFATLYTDWLWFKALGFGNVFGTRFSAQILSFFIFGAIFWVFGAANMLVALNSGTGRRLSSIGIRQRLVTTPVTLLALLGVFLTGLIFAQVAASQWQTILTFLNQVPFNIKDPIWHRDVSFYTFTLPFYRFLWGWCLGALILVGLVTGGIYAFRSGLQGFGFPSRGIRHLSVLAGLFAGLLAWNYRLDLYELLLSKHGYVYGAGYTDVNVRIPLYWVMFGLMVVVGIGLLLNAGPGLVAPLPLAAAAWLAPAFVLLVLVPGFVQRVQVQPAELDRENQYIRNEIAFTRQAYGLTDITDKPFAPQDSVTAEAIARNPQTVENARLWDPQLALPKTLQQLQGLRTYYQFSDIAVDRYFQDGQYIQLLLAGRELNVGGLDPRARGWLNVKLQYTHGYGAAAVRANLATDQGLPVLTLKDIPPAGNPTVSQPAIYFGRRTLDYVLAHSKQPEFDYPMEPNQYTRWSGKNGVALSDGLRSLAFAIRLGDANILFSNELTPDTQVLFKRQVTERAMALAPFLKFDSDPYIVVVDGRLYWIQDAYSVSDHYPYSQTALDPFLGQNYIRNSVKAVIDAYDGTTTFYQIDQQDPVIRTYAAIFPKLFTPFSEMPSGLKAHIRYPRDLFGTQSEIFRLYHMQDPTAFYTREDMWNVGTETLEPGQQPVVMRPFYVIMRLPDEPQAEFVTILPYTPAGKTNMIAYLAGRSDGANYGKLLDFRFPKDSLIVGPQQVETNIDQTASIATQFSLLNQQGSRVLRGNLLVLPIEKGLLYIEPIYLQALSGGQEIPQLKKVIVATGQRVAMEDTLDKALAALVGSAPPTTPGGPPPGGTSVASLIAQANEHYARGQDYLKKGDLAGYASEMQQVGQILEQLSRLTGTQPSASPKPTPTPSR
jgi:uncharacterized membrane protein (UPF0182 family)